MAIFLKTSVLEKHIILFFFVLDKGYFLLGRKNFPKVTDF